MYYNAALGLHPKRTLVATANKGYLRRFPGLTAEAINTFVGVEIVTEMGHIRQLSSGTQSTTRKSTRGRPALNILEYYATAEDATAIS